MLATIKIITLGASLILSNFAGKAEASSHARALRTSGTVTEYSIEESNAPVLASWKAVNGYPRAVILAIHGFGLHKYAFRPFAEEVRQQGVSTYALDIRGFGAWKDSKHSDRRLNLTKALEDIKSTLQQLNDENPGVPIFLLGESMGGALALRAATESPQLVSGVISSVPSGQLVKKKTLALEIGLSFLLKAGQKINISEKILSRATADKSLMRDWLADDSVRLTVGKLELLQFSKFMNGNDRAVKSLKTTAVLMIQGKQDRLVEADGTVRLYEELGAADKTMLMVSNGEHLLFEEGQIDHNLMANVSQWLDNHSPKENAIVAINY